MEVRVTGHTKARTLYWGHRSHTQDLLTFTDFQAQFSIGRGDIRVYGSIIGHNISGCWPEVPKPTTMSSLIWPQDQWIDLGTNSLLIDGSNLGQSLLYRLRFEPSMAVFKGHTWLLHIKGVTMTFASPQLRPLSVCSHFVVPI